MNLFRHITTIQMFDHTIAYCGNWLNFVASIWSFLFLSVFVLLLGFEMLFFLSTITCSLVAVFWTLFFCNFFSIFSGVGKRFVSDKDGDVDNVDDDDDSEDGDDDDNDDDHGDDYYDKDDDNIDDDDEDDDSDDGDDDDWLLCCNCNISLHLANWFNNELIVSSLDFNCFRTLLLVYEP